MNKYILGAVLGFLYTLVLLAVGALTLLFTQWLHDQFGIAGTIAVGILIIGTVVGAWMGAEKSDS